MSPDQGAATPIEREILVGGDWSTSPSELTSRAAGTQRTLGRSWSATADQLEEATVAAVESFGALRRMASHERAQILEAAAEGLRSHAGEEISRLLAQESGKPLADSRTEVTRTATALRYAAGEAERLHGEALPLDIIPSSRGHWAITRRMPIGPVAAITPFNVPLNLSTHKIAPALAVGNPVVLKPDSRVALTMLTFAQVLVDAGVPPGALSVLPMEVEVADAMVTDERFRLLSFTGSAAVGWDMRARAGTKRVVLELGGDASVVVAEDADVDAAVSATLRGAFKHAGQLCISVQHLLVDRSLYDEVITNLAAGAERLRVGDPLEEGVDIGPMISEGAARRAVEQVEKAVARGATLLSGGRCDGAYMQPTVLVNVPSDSPLCVEEAFAPILTIEAFDRFHDAINRVNASAYGLQTGVFTRDVGAIWHAFEELEVGGVIIDNVPTYRVDHMPYGGVKRSGLGREGIPSAIGHMTEPRVLVLDPPEVE